MLDISGILKKNIDEVMEQWRNGVRQDRRIQKAKYLDNELLSNSMPVLLDQLVNALNHPPEESCETVINASVEHATHRAKEGYDAAEIAREYSILRRVIFSQLEPALLEASPKEITRTLHLVNEVIDEAMSQCFQMYVQERLKELEQLRSQLMLTNKEMERLLRSSRDSLAYMAHEFKTPLTSIIGYSDLYLRQLRQKSNPEDNLPSIRSIEQVLRGGRQLLHIVNDALELARYEEGKIQLNLIPTEIRLIVKDVVETIEPLAQAKQLQMQVHWDSTAIEVVTDPCRLQTILSNLLSNAVRYTDRGSISVECKKFEENWSLVITDTGIGIAAEDQGAIFEPYTQAFAKKGRQESESTGLGLAIVSRLVKVLQGDIKVESQEGVGSTFTVTFPIRLKIDRSSPPDKLS